MHLKFQALIYQLMIYTYTMIYKIKFPITNLKFGETHCALGEHAL